MVRDMAWCVVSSNMMFSGASVQETSIINLSSTSVIYETPHTAPIFSNKVRVSERASPTLLNIYMNGLEDLLDK